MCINFSRIVFAMLVLAGAMVGCSPMGPFHIAKDAPMIAAKNSAPYTGCFLPPGNVPTDACVRFVEYDDFGKVLKSIQMDETVAAAKGVAEHDGVVVVYVHGWHHNAEPDDVNLANFQKAISNAQRLINNEQSNGPRASQVRREVAGQKRREVLGIYVGWRGESLDIPGVNNITFWERKTTAQAVGDGAVFELFRKLAKHREIFPGSRLMIIGHSFGAAVTYSALAHLITNQIITDPPPEANGNRSTLDDRKLWDLVVLLNPAFEAMQIRANWELARSRQYASNQLPHLVIVTSEADQATRKLFSSGRYFRSLFNNYYDEESGNLYRTAVGHYLPYITHQLVVKEDCTRFVDTLPAPKAADEAVEKVRSQYLCFDNKEVLNAVAAANPDQEKPKPVMWTRCDKVTDCDLVAEGHALGLPENFPIMNIRTTSDIMSNHTDIWNNTMRAFLIQLLQQFGKPAPPGNPPKSD